MRHNRLGELGPDAIAISSLAHRLKTPSSELHPISGGGATERLPPMLRPTLGAKALPAVTSAAKSKLNATPLAEREPVLCDLQETPCRQFLDMELEP